jgi:hypothetical protein
VRHVNKCALTLDSEAATHFSAQIEAFANNYFESTPGIQVVNFHRQPALRITTPNVKTNYLEEIQSVLSAAPAVGALLSKTTSIILDRKCNFLFHIDDKALPSAESRESTNYWPAQCYVKFSGPLDTSDQRKNQDLFSLDRINLRHVVSQQKKDNKHFSCIGSIMALLNELFCSHTF